MKAFRIAWSLILIPRLFISLILFPLLLSMILVASQIVVTGLFITATTKSREVQMDTIEAMNKNSVSRTILYGEDTELEPLKICRWVNKITPSGTTIEAPPSAECAPDRLDVAIQVDSPLNFDPSEYTEMFDGNIERLHICKTCRPDIIISFEGDETRTEIRSIPALWVMKLATHNEKLLGKYVEIANEFHQTKDLIGPISLHMEGLRKPVMISGLIPSLAALMNIPIMLIITLWLAVKAHRNVLDYFSNNGALLPMVAATGEGAFYMALWILTLVRVAAFLVAAVPMTYFGFTAFVSSNKIESLFSGDPLEFTLWVIAIAASLGLATLVSSMAQLKHRHNFLSFTYKYIPLVLCFVGAAVWTTTFLFDGLDLASSFRSATAALPIIGLTPILVAPIFKPEHNILVFHTLMTTGLLVLLLKSNARWFAAHLEEI